MVKIINCVGACLLVVAGIGCAKDDAKDRGAPAPRDPSSPAPTAGEPAPAISDRVESKSPSARALGEIPQEKLLEQAVERRLYSSRLESSSFLWTDWNRFQENYHPNYLMDGDPKTAWVEGAEGVGVGEWVRVHLSPVAGASQLRVRVRNGYQKSKQLYRLNARLQMVELRTLPAGTRQTFELADSMDWQELTLPLVDERVEGLELWVRTAYSGSKYLDLCVSDLEVFVTGRTADNPAFEKRKLESLLTWKQERIETARAFASARTESLPILDGYRVVAGEPDSKQTVAPRGNYPWAMSSLERLAAVSPDDREILERARAALSADFEGWRPAQLVIKDALDVPEVDGLEQARGVHLLYGWPEDAFLAPVTSKGSLLSSRRFSLFDAKADVRDPERVEECREGEVLALRPATSDGPDVRELQVWHCVVEDGREGPVTYFAWQLYEYGDDGWLRALVTANGAQLFRWEQGAAGPVIVGGLRTDGGEGRVDRLVSRAEVATP